MLSEALSLYILCSLAMIVSLTVLEWLNTHLGQPIFRFPSKKTYYLTLFMVTIVFTISFWLSYPILNWIMK